MYQTLAALLILTTSSALGEEEETDPFILTLESLNDNFFSQEAKDSALKMGEFMANLLDEVEDIAEEVKSLNLASVSFKNYKDALKSAKGSKCEASGAPNGYEDVEEIISSTVDSCVFSISVDDLEAVIKELEMLQKNLQDLDLKFKTVQNKEEQKKFVQQIINIFSAAEEKKLKELEVSDIKKALESCTEETTKDLWTELDSCTKKIKYCLAKPK